MSQVLGEDTAPWLVFLGDVIAGLIGATSGLTASNLIERCGAGDVDLGRAKLGVVEQKGGLGGGLLLECNGGRLARVCRVGLRSDGEVLDLATTNQSAYA